MKKFLKRNEKILLCLVGFAMFIGFTLFITYTISAAIGMAIFLLTFAFAAAYVFVKLVFENNERIAKIKHQTDNPKSNGQRSHFSKKLSVVKVYNK